MTLAKPELLVGGEREKTERNGKERNKARGKAIEKEQHREK